MSTSARLALAERELAEMIAQRDEALDELDACRRENAKLREELERARSYKALYAAAHEVSNHFLGCGDFIPDFKRGMESKQPLFPGTYLIKTQL